jgi:integrase
MRGDGRIFLRAKSSYWVAFMLDGKEKREPAHTSDPKEAEKYLRSRLDERGAARRGVEVFTTNEMKRVTVHELLENVKADLRQNDKPASAQTLSTIRIADEGIPDKGIPGFGHYKAMALSSQHVKDYIARQLADGYKPATINRVTGMLRHAFTLAVREGKVSRAPYIKQLSESGNVRQGFCSEAEFLRVREYLPADLQDFCEFGFRSGWRKGEISGLTWDNVQDGDRTIRLRPDQCKNGLGRSIPVSSKLAPIIARRRQARAFQITNLVFHRHGGREITEFRKAWAKACKLAGKPGLLFHDLRRSAVTALVNSGAPQLVAMSISGHQTPSMFRRYNIPIENEQRKVMEQREAWDAAETANASAQQANVRTMAASK